MTDLVKRLRRYEPDNPPDNAPSMKDDPTGDWVRYDEAAAALEAKDAEIARLVQDLLDVRTVAESYTSLVRCKSGRIRNSNRGPYVCMICGADTADGDPCRAALQAKE